MRIGFLSSLEFYYSSIIFTIFALFALSSFTPFSFFFKHVLLQPQVGLFQLVEPNTGSVETQNFVRAYSRL